MYYLLILRERKVARCSAVCPKDYSSIVKIKKTQKTQKNHKLIYRDPVRFVETALMYTERML